MVEISPIIVDMLLSPWLVMPKLLERPMSSQTLLKWSRYYCPYLQSHDALSRWCLWTRLPEQYYSRRSFQSRSQM